LDYSTENKFFATVDTFISVDYFISPTFSFFLEAVFSGEIGISPVVCFVGRDDLSGEVKCSKKLCISIFHRKYHVLISYASRAKGHCNYSTIKGKRDSSPLTISDGKTLLR
jgi:hypothetical protein